MSKMIEYYEQVDYIKKLDLAGTITKVASETNKCKINYLVIDE